MTCTELSWNSAVYRKYCQPKFDQMPLDKAVLLYAIHDNLDGILCFAYRGRRIYRQPLVLGGNFLVATFDAHGNEQLWSLEYTSLDLACVIIDRELESKRSAP